jgi:glucose-1-phosphatase
MNTKLVLFDLGKVLLDYSFDNAFRHWSAKCGVPAEGLRDGFPFDETYKLHERGLISIEEFHRHLCQALSMDLSLEDFVAGWNALLIGPYPCIAGLIDRVRGGARKAMLSNSNETHVAYLRRKWPSLFSGFDSLFFSNEIHMRKPDTEAFLHVLDSYGFKPSEVLFFDDLEDNVEAARALGIRCVRVVGSEAVESALLDHGLLD